MNMEQQSRPSYLDDDLIDDIEAKIVTETLLGELGSSTSALQQERDSGDEELNFLDADSGASDRGKNNWLERDDINLSNTNVRRSASVEDPPQQDLQQRDLQSIQSRDA